MSSHFSWINKIVKSWSRNKNEGRRRPYRHQEVQPHFETLEDRVVPTTYSWLPTAAGTFAWNSATNWSVISGTGTTFPNAQGDVAIIQSALTGAETITLNQAIIVGTLDIGASSGTNAFTIAPGTGGTLALSVASGSATVAKTAGGADQITAPITFSSASIFNNTLAAPNTLAITGATTGAFLVTVNSPTTNTGEVDFTASGALSGAAGITVDKGTLGINSVTLSHTNVITIATGAVVNSSGTISTTAYASATYNAVTGAGTLNFTSTTNNATSSPDFYFNSNDAANSTANYGSRIASAVNLGSTQRYFWGNTNHNGVNRYGTSADCVISGSISGTGGITFVAQDSFTGSGPMETPLYLTAANTFTGPLVITRGSVYLGNASALPSGDNVTLNPTSGSNARLFLYGNSATIGNLTSSGAGTAEIANSGGGNGTYGNTSPATLTINQTTAGTFSGAILQDQPEYYTAAATTSGALSLVKQGSATLTLAGTDTYIGTTTVTAGVLSVGADANLGAAPTAATAGTIVLNGGTLLASTSFTLNSNRGINVGAVTGTAAGTGEIDVAAGKTLTYTGVISDNGSGNLIVGSTGNTGTLALGGANTNALTTLAVGTLQDTGTLGAVTVAGGTLNVAGAGTAGAVTINSGTLGGSGTVGAVTDNAIINPGLGATSILNTGNLAFGAGAVFSVDVAGASAAGTSYDQLNVTGAINLTGASLQLNLGYSPTIGDSYTIIHNVNGTPITGTFTGLSEGGYFVVSGHLFQITYLGNSNNDVVVTAVTAPVYYVEADAWMGQGAFIVGQTIPDADPVAAGNQPAKFGGSTAVAGSGDKAFTSVNAALTQIADDNAVGAALIDNGGTFNEDVVLNQPMTLTLQNANSTFNSLADTLSNASISINGVLLTTGGDNVSSQVSSTITGSGSVLKTGTGTWTLAGNNSYTGTTEVGAGALTVGSATALGVNPTVTVDAGGTLTLNGNSYTINSLTGAGTVQDASASSVTLTVSTAAYSTTFSGILQNGTGAGLLSLAVTGAGTLTLSGTSSTYTGATTIGTGTTLNVQSLAASGSPSSIGAATNSASNLVLQGAILDFVGTGATASTDHNFTLGVGGGSILVNNPTTTLTLSGNATGGTAFTSGGAGTLVFSTPNATYTGTNGLDGAGAITVSAGNLQTAAMLINTTRTVTIASGASFTANGTLWITAPTGGNTTVILGPGTLNLNVANSSIATPDLYYSPQGGLSNYSAYISAPVNLGSGSHYIEVQSNNNDYSHYLGDLSLNAAITGTSASVLNVYGLPESQDGVLVLNANNSSTFFGSVNIVRGDLGLANQTALTAANSVTFSPTGTNNAALYLFGNNVTIGNLASAGTGNQYIRNGSVTGHNGVQQNATLTVTQSTPATFSGILSDGPDDHRTGDAGTYYTLSLAKTGLAALTLTGNSTYTGATTISSGVLAVSSLANGGTSATNGVGNSPSGIGSSTNAATNLVLDGGTLQYTGAATSTDRLFTVTNNGGAIDASGTGALSFSNTGTTVFTGTTAGSFTLTGASTGANTFAPIIADGLVPTSLTKSGVGTWILTGTNTFTGGTTVAAGTLEGTGTIGAVVDNASLSAGVSATGFLTTGNLSFGSSGIYVAYVNGTTAGTSYNQLDVNGSISLSGSTLQFNLGYIPSVGDSYTLIHNVTGAAITGSFAGLSQGSYFFNGGQLFQISYQGNGTNDVVVTAVAPPTYYAEADGWVSQGTFTAGQTVPDADPVVAGSQPATFGGGTAVLGSGYKAFTSVNAALAQIADDNALGAKIVVNQGTYAEDVSVNGAVTLLLQSGPISFNSLADTVNTATLNLSGITLTTGGDNLSTQFSSNIIGSGNLIKAGSGTMTLAGANIYSGTTEVSGGILQAGSLTGLSANSATTVDAGATLLLNGFNSTLASLAGPGTVADANANSATLSTGSIASNFAGVLQDGAGGGMLSLAKIGAATFSLSGTNTYSGSTTISAGTLQLGNAGTTGSVLGNITDNATLAFNRTNPLSYAAIISGTGGVTQAGANTLTLTGANTYTGVTTVNSGILQIGAAGALGTNPTVVVNTGGDLQLNGISYTFGSLAGAGTLENANATAATLATGSTASTFAGILQDGTGGGSLSLTKIGAATFTLSGTNSTYSGATTVGAGVLAVSGLANGLTNSSIGASANTATDLVLSGGGTLDYVTVGSTVSTDRSLTVGTGGGVIEVADPGSTVTFTGLVSGGTNALTTLGAGTLVFSTANALSTGNINVSSGTLVINSLTVSKTRVINIASGAFVQSTGQLSTTADGSLNPNVQVIGAGTLQLRSTTNDGVNSYDLFFNSNDVAGSTANWGTGISAKIDLGSSQRYFTGQSNHNGYGEYGTSTDCYISGVISGTGGITFVGQPTLRTDMEMPFVLAGANTFTGPVVIQRGSVYLVNAQALNGNNVTFNVTAGQGNLFLYGNNITIGTLTSTATGGVAQIANGNRATSAGTALSAVTLTVNQASNSTFNGLLLDSFYEYASSGANTQGPLSLVKQGTGNLTLTGANNYSGTTTVLAGTLGIGSDAELGTVPLYPTTGSIVIDGGTLLATSTFTLNSYRGITVGAVTGPGSGEIDVAAGQTLTYAGAIADNGSGNLIVGSGANTGVLSLSGSNTNNTTTVAAGTLADNGSLGTTVVTGGVLGGPGTVGTLTDNAIINPGLGATNILNTGNLSFGTAGIYSVDVNGTNAGASYDQLNVTGSINLTGATLQLVVGYTPLVGDSYTIIHNVNGTPITGTFNGLSEGSYFVASGYLFQITYLGNSNNDVVVTAVTAPVYYVESDAWVGQGTFSPGQTIPDADPIAAGNQPASFGGGTAVVGSGYKAFTSVDAAMAQIVDDNAIGAQLIDNGGTFNEDVVISQSVAVTLQNANSTFNSLSDTATNGNISLNGVTLTTGGDNVSSTVSAPIVGSGSLVKAGTGTFTLSGNNSFTGGTTINAGTIKVANANALGSYTVTVNAGAILQMNGTSLSLSGLTGGGTVDNSSATPVTLTVSATSTTTFAGVLSNTGAGPLSLLVTGAGAFTLSGNASTYTGSTTVNGIQATLDVASLAIGGAPSSIGASTNAASNLVLTVGGTLNDIAIGATQTTDRSVTIGTGGGDINVADPGTTVTFTGSVSGGTNIFTASGFGLLVFSTPNAFTTGGIVVSSGTLGINTITLSKNEIITINAGAFLNSFGTINLTADPSLHPNVQVTGQGTLNLTSTTNNATTPDLYFDYNDVNNAANWGTGISANINLGSSQRYFFAKDNHDSYGNYGMSADAYLSGSISGSGGISFIAQNSYQNAEASQTDFVLAGNNSFSGEVEIQRGALYLTNLFALTQNNVLVLDPAAGFNSWFYLYGNSTTVSNLQSSGAGTAIIANSSGNSVAAATLTILENNNTTYNGAFTDLQSDYAGSGTVGGLSIAEAGTAALTLTGSSSTSGSVAVTSGTLVNNGSYTASAGITVAIGATLEGSGANDGGVTVSGTLQAGTAPATGQLAADTLAFGSGGTLNVALNGSTSGTGYGQVTVTTSVNLTNAVLNIVSVNANQLTGAPLVIVNNFVPASPITGTFMDTMGNNLPEGATITASGVTFTISYVGGANGDSVTLTPNQATTTTAVGTSQTGPFSTTTLFTFTATIASTPASTVSTGTVTFYAGPGLTNPIGSPVPVSSGTAISVATTLPAGSDTITAVYSGAASYAGSQGTTTVTVNGVSTTTTLTDNGPNPSTSGQTVNFTGTVSGGVPTGDTVSLEDASNGNTVVATTTTGTGGSFSFNVSTLSVGSHNLFAVFAGDPTYSTSQSSQVTQVVNSSAPPPTVTSIVVNADPSDNLAGTHSRVTSLYVTFSAAVQLGTTPFTLALHSGVNVNGTTGQQVGALPAALHWSSSDNIHWTITFSGANVNVGSDGHLTIMDGVYDLTVVAGQVHPLGVAGVNMASNYTQTFWALFGDTGASDSITTGTIGDGHTTIGVGNGDFNAFANAYQATGYNVSNGYDPRLDVDGDGSIGNVDFNAFANNYQTIWTF